MRAGLAVLIVLSGCGRFGFGEGEARGDGGVVGDGGTGEDALPPGSSLALSVRGSVEIGTDVHRLLVKAPLLFAATARPGAELAIFDISTPATPVEIGSAATAGIPYGLELVDSHLYVTTETGGDDLEIFDISNPAAPTKLGGKPTDDTAYRVRVENARAYVTTAAGGDDLEIFDVANPGAPVKLGGLDLLPSYYVRGIDVSGTIAYTAGQRLNTIDVSNPAAPVILGDEGFYWYAYDLEVINNRAFAIESNNSNAPQLRVFDVADVANPTLTGTAETWDSYARDIEVVGSYAFTVCAPGGYDWGAELEVFDVSGTGDPTLAGAFHLEHDGYAVAVVGDHVYVGAMTSEDPELLVFQVSAL